MEEPRIDITLYPGRWTNPIRVSIPLEGDLVLDVLEPLEWSNESFFLLLKSIATPHRDYVKFRNDKQALRRWLAKDCAHQITDALVEMLGSNDTEDGYHKDDFSVKSGRNR